MLKKTLVTITVLVAVSTAALAQKAIYDVVYLKNGSVLKGTIVEQLPDSLVKIEIAGGSIIAVSMEELGSIAYRTQMKSSSKMPEDHMEKQPLMSRKERGYFNITELGFLPGANNDYYYGYNPSASLGVTIQTIHGYRFNPYLLAGAGLALDIIDHPVGQLFADARWEILNKKSTPFVFADAGYGVPFSKGYEDSNVKISYQGGMTAGAGIGMRINFGMDAAFLLEVGYKMEKISQSYNYEMWGTDETYKYTYNRLAIRMGLAF